MICIRFRWNRGFRSRTGQVHEFTEFNGSTLSEPGARRALNLSQEGQRAENYSRATGATMGQKGDAAGALVRNLNEAIARVREDVEKVEFWADAVSGFTKPVPAYATRDVNVWVPPEQARALSDNNENECKPARRNSQRRRTGDEKARR